MKTPKTLDATSVSDRCFININGYDAEGKFVHGWRRYDQNIENVQGFVAEFRKAYPQARAVVVRCEFMDYVMQRGEK